MIGAAIVLLAVAAVAAGLHALRASLPRRPSAFDAAVAAAPDTGARPASLEAVERLVAGATAHAGDLHFRLRPVLREIATGALRGRGVDLDRGPEAARALLGEEVWEIVRPDRPRPEEPFAPGLAPDALARVLDVLEELQR
jgi:hypothetical protein